MLRLWLLGKSFLSSFQLILIIIERMVNGAIGLQADLWKIGLSRATATLNSFR